MLDEYGCNNNNNNVNVTENVLQAKPWQSSDNLYFSLHTFSPESTIYDSRQLYIYFFFPTGECVPMHLLIDVFQNVLHNKNRNSQTMSTASIRFCYHLLKNDGYGCLCNAFFEVCRSSILRGTIPYNATQYHEKKEVDDRTLRRCSLGRVNVPKKFFHNHSTTG